MGTLYKNIGTDVGIGGCASVQTPQQQLQAGATGVLRFYLPFIPTFHSHIPFPHQLGDAMLNGVGSDVEVVHVAVASLHVCRGFTRDRSVVVVKLRESILLANFVSIFECVV